MECVESSVARSEVCCSLRGRSEDSSMHAIEISGSEGKVEGAEMLHDVRSEDERLRSLEVRVSGSGAEAGLKNWNRDHVTQGPMQKFTDVGGFAVPQAESPQTRSQACEENVRNSWHEGICTAASPEV